MTTFIRIHCFYRSRLDEQFFNSIKRSTSHALLKRHRCAEEKVFFSAQEREGKQRSQCASLYTVSWNAHFRIHINVSELFVKIQLLSTLSRISRIPIASTFVCFLVMKRRREWGEVSCKKSDGWPRDGVLYIGWNILAILGKKGAFTTVVSDINGVVTLWKLFSRG